MSDAIPVFHPAPMRYVPRGGRQERLGFLGLVTPARLAEADPSAFEPLGTLARGAESAFRRGAIVRDRPLFARDGAIWMDLHDRDGRPLTRAALAAFLASGQAIARDDPHDLGYFFHRTPAMAGVQAYDRTKSTVAREGMRAVVQDGGERARADLLRFLEGDVAIVAGTARVRLRPVARLAYEHEDGRTWRVAFSTFPRPSYTPPEAGALDDPGGFLDRQVRARALRLDEGNRLDAPGGRDPAGYYGISGGPRPFPFHLARGSVAGLFANACHGAALRLAVVAEALQLAGRDGGLPDAAARILPRARAWEALGAVSGVRPDETEACIEDFRVLCRALREAFPRPGNSPSLARLMRAIDGSALPDLRGDAAPPPEDEEALAGLGPAR